MLNIAAGNVLKSDLRRKALAILALLALGLPSSAAPGTSVVLNVTAPGGFINDGARQWVTDASLGFCRIAGGNLTNCVKPSPSAVLGQPAYSPATGFVYLPDQSAGSLGIWRYSLVNGNINNASRFNVAAAAGLGVQRPKAVAVGPDGNLYASMGANSSILRINTPAAATQTVDNMAVTKNGKPAGGLAIVGTQLWVAEDDGVVVFPDPAGCGVACRGALSGQVGVKLAKTIAFDGPNSLVYIGTPSGAFQADLVSGLTVFYSASYVRNGVPGLYSNVTAVGVDNLGNLFIGDDPAAGQTVGAATIFEVPAGSDPDGQGPVPSPTPVASPTVLTTPLANPATLVATGLTNPTGVVFMGTHVWVADAARGFCRVDPGTPAPSLTNCAVLPAGFVVGAPAFDGTTRVYLPDTSGTFGIVRLTFNTAAQTVTGQTTVVSNAVLVAAAPGSTAPVALAFDGAQLYVSMAGSASILKVTGPATNAHTTKSIGTMDVAGPLSIAFHGADLWSTSTPSVLQNATVCAGACVSVILNVPIGAASASAMASSTNLIYVGDSGHIWEYDPIVNTFQNLADTGLLAANSPTTFGSITSIVLDTTGKVFATEGNRLWSIVGSVPQLTSILPASGVLGSTVPVVINGFNLTGPTLNLPTGITAAGVTVSAAGDKINANFGVALTATPGANVFTVTTTKGQSNPLSFGVNVSGPVLTTITPASGVIGTTFPVTIAGTNLAGATLNLPTGVTATAVTSTATSITATFAIAATAPVAATSVSVNTAGGASNALPFSTAPAAPTLTSISPTSGVVGTNVAVTLTGTNLTGATLTLPTGITLLAPETATATQVTATFVIAANTVLGAKTITATTPGGAASVTFTVAPPPPTLTTIAPITGVAGTSVPVVLTGTNLTGATVSALTGTGITATIVSTTATTINATLNIAVTATQGAQSIIATTGGGSSNAVTFTVTAPAPPTLTSVTPNTGVQGNTVAAVFAGTNLAGGTLNLPTGITLSGAAAATATQITANLAIASNATLGAQNITVTTPGGTTAAVVFTVNPPTAVLTSITPATGVQGTNVPVVIAGTTLTGSTLTLPTGITTLAAPVVTATQITTTLVIAATATTGAQNITVTTTGGVSNALTFTVKPPAPTLTSMTPAFGGQGATVPVTFAGTNLVGATLNLPAGVTTSAAPVVTATQITASLVIAANTPLGATNITATTTGGTTSAVVFTINPPPPTLTNMTVTSGLQNTSVAVIFNGTNLLGATLNLPAGITTSIPPIASATQIATTLVIANTGGIGPQNITVTTLGGTSNALAFTVIPPPPTLTAIAPTSGVQATSVPVTITGTILTGATLNLPTGITTAAPPVVTATSITATLVIAGTAPTGPQNITVTTLGGTSGAVTFTVVLAPPALTSITPSSGVVGTNVPVTIAGTFLTGATLNLPGGITTLAAPVVTATSITATLVIPAAAPLGAQSITVTTPGGTSNAVSFTTISAAAPTLTSITPAVGNQGATVGVTLVGTNLTAATINPVAGITITVVTSTATSITATFGITAGAALGANLVTVTNAAGTSNPVTFVVNPPPPTLTSITPINGAQGATVGVTLTGTNLAGAAINTIAGITVTGVTSTATSVTASFAIAANAALGARSVTVSTPSGTSNAVTFTVIPPPPTITSITPTSRAQGTTGGVTIAGTNLAGATVTPITGITITGVTSTATSVTATFAIAANAPLGASNVTVTTAGGTSNAVTFTINPPAPTLTSITPTSGALGATVPVTLVGTNLTGATINTIAGVTVTGVTSTATSVTASFAIAANAATGARSVTVTTAGGTSNAVTFTVGTAPTLTSITPATGNRGATVPVTLVGTNLTGATFTAIAGVTITGVTTTATSVTANFAIAAAAALGARSVTVTTAGGTSNAVTFTIGLPTLTTITPNTGNLGATVPVTLAGTNLTGATIGAIAGVTVTGVTSTATSVTASFAIAANAATGARSVTVTTAGGTSNAVTFTVNTPPPTLTSITPTSGALGATVAVTLAGTNLTGATINTIAGVTVTGVTATATSVTASFAIAANAANGARSVTVTTAGGTSNAVTFTVGTPAPTLTTITPATGILGATVPVTLVGTNLTGATISAIAGVTVTGVTATATSVTASFAIAANAAIGARSVTVTTVGGTSNAVTFTVNASTAPTLTSINPNSAPRGTGGQVTLTGTNLTGATMNAVAGVTITNVASTATTMTATWAISATAASGVRNVTVTTANGTSNAVIFTVDGPELNTIAPAAGTRGASVTVNMTGILLTGATVNAIPGITITGVTTTANSVTATFAIAANATVGAKSVTVTTANGTSNALTFTVN